MHPLANFVTKDIIHPYKDKLVVANALAEVIVLPRVVSSAQLANQEHTANQERRIAARARGPGRVVLVPVNAAFRGGQLLLSCLELSPE